MFLNEKMVSMKVVVHRDVGVREVINTEFEQRLRSSNRDLNFDSYTVSRNRNRQVPFYQSRRRSRVTFSLPNDYSRTTNKERKKKYWMKIHRKRNLSSITKKLANLSMNISPVSEAEGIKKSVASGVFQLREPVLQRSMSREESSSSTYAISASETASAEKNQLMESLIETYRCSLCPNLALPEVYECPSGHVACEHCWLNSSHCTRCGSRNKFTFRRSMNLEKLATLIEFPCRWRQQGCSQSFEPAAWRSHVDSCSHAEIQEILYTSSDYEFDV